jgi:hypothetical protein
MVGGFSPTRQIIRETQSAPDVSELSERGDSTQQTHKKGSKYVKLNNLLHGNTDVCGLFSGVASTH